MSRSSMICPTFASSNAIWLFILLISILLRIGVALYLGDNVRPPPGAPDETSYSYLAERVATGYGFSFEHPSYPFGTPAASPTSHWSFGYTSMLAVIYTIFGPHPLVARLFQAVITGILLPMSVYFLARRLLITTVVDAAQREKVALLSAFLAAIYFYFMHAAAILQTESLYIISVLWLMNLTISLADALPDSDNAASINDRSAPRWIIRWVLFGLVLGAATLLRQSIMPVVPLFVVWLLWRGYQKRSTRRVLLGLLVGLLITTLMILPWTLRNLHVYGTFLLLNSNTGYAMYSAQHPMHGTSFQEYAAAPLPDDLTGKNLNEAQWDRVLLQRGIGFVFADPERYLLLSLSRVRAYFEFWPTIDTSLLHNIGRVGSFGILLPFMLYGIWLDLKSRTSAQRSLLSTVMVILGSPSGLIYLFTVYYSLLHILTWAMPRYRLPVDAALLVFAALGLAQVIDWLRRRMNCNGWREEPTASNEDARADDTGMRSGSIRSLSNPS